MNVSIKKAWVKALRSDEYKQGAGCLREKDNYCCLGVLTDLYIKKHDLVWERFGEEYHLHGDSGTLPYMVSEWAEIDTDNPDVCGLMLSQLNDEGVSFNEIADLIEKDL